MPTLLHLPTDPLRPSELDDYLTSGWRPTGQSVYTSDYLRTNEDALYGCLQLRIPLADFHFKKRHRKLLRRNNELFRTEIRRANIPDEAMLAVNRRYLVDNPDKSQENLAFHVIGDQFRRVLDTWESRVYLKNQLIAFSYFDVGDKCVYAKAGIYDPAFGDYSLGTYTMLLELEWAKATGRAFYHPGYYAPQYPAFNYKLNYGPVEYRHPAQGTWQPLTGEPANHAADPYLLCETKLTALQQVLGEAGLQTRLLEYPSFTARYFYANTNLEQEDLLDGALLLQPCGPGVPDEIVIVYDLTENRYVCYETAWAGMQDFKLKPISPANGRRRFDRPVAIHHRILASDDPNDFAAVVTIGRIA